MMNVPVNKSLFDINSFVMKTAHKYWNLMI